MYVKTIVCRESGINPNAIDHFFTFWGKTEGCQPNFFASQLHKNDPHPVGSQDEWDADKVAKGKLGGIKCHGGGGSSYSKGNKAPDIASLAGQAIDEVPIIAEISAGQTNEKKDGSQTSNHNQCLLKSVAQNRIHGLFADLSSVGEEKQLDYLADRFEFIDADITASQPSLAGTRPRGRDLKS